jgi:hypothetical protein
MTEETSDKYIKMEFIDILRANDMFYKFSEPYESENGEYYQIMFGENGTDPALTGTIVTARTIYKCFEIALRLLKEQITNL